MRNATFVGLGLCLSLLLWLAPAASSAQHDDEAHGLFSAGAAAFSSGRYDEALEYFQRAYDLSGRSALLYNVGQAADRGRHDAVALDAFRRYLEANPDVENHEEIEGRIRVLEHAVSTQTPAEPAATDASSTSTTDTSATTDSSATTEDSASTSTSTAPAPAPAASSGGGIDIAGLSLTVAGGVFVIAGAVMLGLGVPGLDPLGPSPTDAETRQHQNALILTGVGAAALSLGVIAGVIGVVILVTGAGSSSSQSALRVGPDGLRLSF